MRVGSSGLKVQFSRLVFLSSVGVVSALRIGGGMSSFGSLVVHPLTFSLCSKGFLKCLLALIPTSVTSKAADEEGDFAELYVFKWTSLLIPPTTVLIVNIIGIVAGVSYAINSEYQSWGPLFGKLFFAIWVIADLYPFLKGLLGRQNCTRTIVIAWSTLLASIFSLLWVRIDPFTSASTKSAANGQCGINC